MIVEDDQICALALKHQLVEQGYEICTICMHEAQAIADAKKYQPDLVCFDYHLAKGTGLRAWKNIRLSEPKTNAVFVITDVNPDILLEIQSQLLDLHLKSSLTAYSVLYSGWMQS